MAALCAVSHVKHVLKWQFNVWSYLEIEKKKHAKINKQMYFEDNTWNCLAKAKQTEKKKSNLNGQRMSFQNYLLIPNDVKR